MVSWEFVDSWFLNLEYTIVITPNLYSIDNKDNNVCSSISSCIGTTGISGRLVRITCLRDWDAIYECDICKEY